MKKIQLQPDYFISSTEAYKMAMKSNTPNINDIYQSIRRNASEGKTTLIVKITIPFDLDKLTEIINDLNNNGYNTSMIYSKSVVGAISKNDVESIIISWSEN